MYKLYLFINFVLVFQLSIEAQTKIRLQGTAAIPTGYAEDAVSVGYGSTFNFSWFVLNQNVELSSTVGVLHFGLKENLPDYDFSFFSIPVLAGIRFNLTDYDFIPYVGIEAGIYFTEYNLEIDYGFFGKEKIITKKVHFGFSPELGFRMNLSPTLDVDVNAKYNNIFTKYIVRAYLLIQAGFAYRL